MLYSVPERPDLVWDTNNMIEVCPTFYECVITPETNKRLINEILSKEVK